MKTQVNLTTINKSFLLAGSILVIGLLMNSCARTVYVTERPVVHQAPPREVPPPRTIAPPVWAPEYDYVEEVHYYYLPDIEIYYDVWRNEYVYLDGGRWIYSARIPSHCAHYDINTGYVIVLERNIHNPWEHHNRYVSNYPKYYYRTKYKDNGNHNGQYRNPRGYNENVRTVIYHDPKNSRNQRGNSSQDRYTPTQNSGQRSNSGNRDGQYQRTYTPSDNSQPSQTQNKREYQRDNGSAPANANGRSNQSSSQQQRTTEAPPAQREQPSQYERRERNPNASRTESQRSNSSESTSRRDAEPVKTEVPQRQTPAAESTPAPQQRERSVQTERRERAPETTRSEAPQRVKSEEQPARSSGNSSESSRSTETRSRSRK